MTVQGNQISIEPATVTVTGRTSPAVKIVWYLATPGYKFVDKAADFTSAYFMSNDSRFCYPWTDIAYVCTDWNADAFPGRRLHAQGASSVRCQPIANDWPRREQLDEIAAVEAAGSRGRIATR